MNRTWEKLKKTYEDNRIALWLLCVFVIFFCIISGPGIAKEASSGSAELTTESLSDAEARAGEDSGAQKKSGAQMKEEKSGMAKAADEAVEDAETGDDAENADKTADLGDEATETERMSDPEGETTEPESATDPEGETAEPESTTDPKGETAEPESATDPEGETAEPESTTEPEGATELENATDPEAETEEPVLGERRLLQLAAQYGASFRIPMVTANEAVLTFLPPGEKWKLRGYEELEAEFEEWQRREKPLGTLERMLTRRLDTYDGDWSVYVKNLSTNESFVVNDRPMKSASVMKLFIMGTVYKAFETGDLPRTDEVLSLVGQMITVSSNEASNELLLRLGDGSYADGIAKVDAFIEEYGFSNMTVEYNGFNNPATNTSSENFNQVAAKDCGKLLEDIYRRTWVNRSVGNEMEDLLLSQETRYKIPAGLPEGVLCGNKTGEMDTTENDAAIIYTDNCDYILVVLSSDWSSKDQAISRIQSISSATWKYLNLTEYEMVVAE